MAFFCILPWMSGLAGIRERSPRLVSHVGKQVILFDPRKEGEVPILGGAGDNGRLPGIEQTTRANLAVSPGCWS